MTTTTNTPQQTLTTIDDEKAREAFLDTVENWQDTLFYEKYNRLSCQVWYLVSQGDGNHVVYMEAWKAYDAYQERVQEGLPATLFVNVFRQTGAHKLTLVEQEQLLPEAPKGISA